MIIKPFETIPPKTDRTYKIAMYGNSPNIRTGFSKVIREIGTRLSKDTAFEIHYIGENYRGEPINILGGTLHGINPANPANQSTFFDAAIEVIKKINPDVLFILEDTFTMAHQNFYNWSLKYGCPLPLIFYLPLDGGVTPTNGLPILRMSDKIVSMANYTHDEAKRDGFDSDIIWHGVDLFTFRPVSKIKKKELRRKYGVPEDCFLIFNYGRNSLRKNNPSLMCILAEYFKDKDPNTHKAFLHINNFAQTDLNLIDTLTRIIPERYNINMLETKHVFLNPKADDRTVFVHDNEIAEYIQMSDIAISATSGEGSGLLMPEAMACEIPVIHPDFTTPHEWLIEERGGIGKRGITIPCDTIVTHSFNTSHGYVNIPKFVEAITYLEQHPEVREEMGRNGRKFVTKFANWDYLVEQWKDVIRKVC